MRVFIGPYRRWIGPFQIADWLQYVGVNEDKCHEIGKFLADTWLRNVCEWIDSKKKRNIKIKLHDYDIWSMDHTLSLIILPMLIKLKETKHGASWVDDEDVPEELKSTSAPPKEDEWGTDDNFFKRFDYILDEMIWAFEQIVNDDWELKFFTDSGLDREGQKKYQDRISNGLRLFGKYFQGLWT